MNTHVRKGLVVGSTRIHQKPKIATEKHKVWLFPMDDLIRWNNSPYTSDVDGFRPVSFLSNMGENLA